MKLSSRPPLSLRERNKRRTLAAIRDAAWGLFVDKGFDGATTREIAERAGVAAGTVFLHARDKDELLVMVYLQRASEAFERGFDEVAAEGPLVERLLSVFGVFFDEYATQPALALKFLCATLTMKGPQAIAQGQVEARFLERLAALLERARDRGETRDDLDAHGYARNLFALYRFVVLRWLAGESASDPSTGRAQLRDAFTVAHAGARPRVKKRATVAPDGAERYAGTPSEGIPKLTPSMGITRPGSAALSAPRVPADLARSLPSATPADGARPSRRPKG